MLVFSVNPALGFLGVVGIALVVAILALVLTFQHPTEVRKLRQRLIATGNPDVIELAYLAAFFVCVILITFTGFR